MSLNALLFAVVASFVMPILLAVAFTKGNADKIPGKRLVPIFLLGCLAYAVAELVIREWLLLDVILENFRDTDWYYMVLENGVPESALYYSIFTGTTMGILQELLRFAVFFIAVKVLKEKSTTMTASSVYAFGSGFVEAVAMLGIMAFSYLAESTGDSSVLDDIGSTRAILAGIERIVYLFYHVGYSMLIVYGFKNHKKIIMLLTAMVLHIVLTTVDCYLGKIGLEYATLIFINALVAAAVCGLAVLLWKKVNPEKMNNCV